MSKIMKTQVAVIGGGIAGLWTQALLRTQGYSTLLIEKNAIAEGQTIASQGMIHGGQRYSLMGQKSGHTESISEMPGLWESALNGKDPVNLSVAKSLSETQVLWSPGGFFSQAAAFFASKALQASVKTLKPGQFPKAFRDQKKFNGTVFELPERVMDIESLVEAFASQSKGDWLRATPIEGQFKDQKLTKLVVKSASLNSAGPSHERGSPPAADETFEIEADAFVFSAGLGNEWAADRLFKFEQPVYQRRPLKQILVCGEDLPPLFGHCITADPRPRVTITTHSSPHGTVWYLGGLVAVFGTEHSEREAVENANRELSELFKHISFKNKNWAVHHIERAEHRVTNFLLPEKPELKTKNNMGLLWPTKMTFAPLAARSVLDWVQNQNIKPDSGALVSTSNISASNTPTLAPLPWKSTALRFKTLREF
jgi:hypothetical protein